MKLHIVILTALAALTACSGTQKAQHSRPQVTVSIPPQAWLLKSIAGDSVDINILLAKGANPETFEPGVNTIKAASHSDIVMLSGALGFETALADRLKSNNQQLHIVDTSTGIEPIYGTHSHACNHEHGHNDIADPHTWTSVRNARVIAANMLNALVEADPENAEWYTKRAAQLDARLDSIDRCIAARLDSVETRAFLVWHPSLSYFARDYNLEQISIGSEGRESTIPGIRSIVDKAGDHACNVLFIQADYDSNRAQTLSAETGAEVVTINPLDTDWESQINIIANALAPN